MSAKVQMHIEFMDGEVRHVNFGPEVEGHSWKVTESVLIICYHPVTDRTEYPLVNIRCYTLLGTSTEDRQAVTTSDAQRT